MSELTPLTRVWARALDANLRYAALLSGLAVRSLELLVSTVSEIGPQITSSGNGHRTGNQVTSGSPAMVPAPSPAAMVLEGVAGSSAMGFFVVENKLPQQVSTCVEVGPLVNPDGQEIPSVLRFEPGVLTLAPGEQVIAKVSALISRSLAPEVRYEGKISVPGIAGASIPIIVRRIRKTTSATVVSKESSGKNPPEKSACERPTSEPPVVGAAISHSISRQLQMNNLRTD
jgi:hypothetical protein